MQSRVASSKIKSVQTHHHHHASRRPRTLPTLTAVSLLLEGASTSPSPGNPRSSPLVPVIRGALFTIEGGAHIIIDNGKLISNRNRSFQVANIRPGRRSTASLAVNSLHSYCVRAQYADVDGNLGNATAFSSALLSGASEATAPAAQSSATSDQGGDQVPTEKNGELAFNAAQTWTARNLQPHASLGCSAQMWSRGNQT